MAEGRLLLDLKLRKAGPRLTAFTTSTLAPLRVPLAGALQEFAPEKEEISNVHGNLEVSVFSHADADTGHSPKPPTPCAQVCAPASWRWEMLRP